MSFVNLSENFSAAGELNTRQMRTVDYKRLCVCICRMRISYLVEKALSHYRQHCLANTERFLHTVKEWYRSASAVTVFIMDQGCIRCPVPVGWTFTIRFRSGQNVERHRISQPDILYTYFIHQRTGSKVKKERNTQETNSNKLD